MAVAHGHAKIYVLDFSRHIAAVRNHFLKELSSCDSSTQVTPASLQPPDGTNALGHYGFHLWNGIVDYLEGKALGKRLGNCHESDLRSYFPPAIHHPLTTDLGPSLKRLVYWNSRIGRLLVAR